MVRVNEVLTRRFSTNFFNLTFSTRPATLLRLEFLPLYTPLLRCSSSYITPTVIGITTPALAAFGVCSTLIATAAADVAWLNPRSYPPTSHSLPVHLRDYIPTPVRDSAPRFRVHTCAVCTCTWTTVWFSHFRSASAQLRRR